MQNIFHTAREWLTRNVRRAKDLKLDSKLFVQSLAAILAVLLVIIVIVLSTPNPEWIYPILGLSQKSDVLRFLGFGIGGTLLALGIARSIHRMDSKLFVRLLAAILGILLVIIVIVIFTPSPEWIYPFLGLSQKNDVLRFLGFGIGGTLLALSAVISYKRAKAFEDTAANQEKGLRQERLKNAIKHLADRSASVRLGGAYELFHLAKDTRALDQTEDLSQTALDILCAHIRQTTREAEYIQKYRSEPSEEIQSLLNLLFVQKHEVFKDRNINLRRAFLRGSDLVGARLQKADLRGAELQSADLRRVRLQKADLRGAELQSADLRRVRLQKADLRDVKLRDADLRRVRLQKADLRGAELQDADLRKARLRGIILEGTRLQKADLRRARLQGAYLWLAHLEGANLEEARLKGADLRGAWLQGAGLWSAHLEGAKLDGARLQGTDLDSTHLEGADLRIAHLEGANIDGALLQGADLDLAHLQGVSSASYASPVKEVIFEDQIRQRIGEKSDLSHIIFSGGLNQEDVDSIAGSMPDDEQKKRLQERLKPHVDKPASHELPQNSGAIIGSYTKEEAEKWIAEYNKAMGYKEDPTP